MSRIHNFIKFGNCHNSVSFIAHCKHYIDMIYGSRDISWHPRFYVLVWKIMRCRKWKPFSRIFKIHDLYKTASISPLMCKLACKLDKAKPIWPRWRHQWRHSTSFNIVLYSLAYQRVATPASSKANISGMNPNIVIIFVGYKRRCQ